MKNKVLKISFYVYICIFAFNNKVYASNLDCNSWGDVKTDIQNIFNFMKFLVPILVIGLSIYDFIKAISQKDEKDIKKAFSKLLKRMIFAIIFFFLPMLLNLLLELFEANSEVCVK